MSNPRPLDPESEVLTTRPPRSPSFLWCQEHIYIQEKASKLMIIIIIYIFKEDNVLSMIASLSCGPPLNTDTDSHRTFFRLLLFCECYLVSCAIFVRRRESSACLIILSTKQGSHGTILTPLVWRGQDSNPRPPDPKADALPISHGDRLFYK